MVMILTEWKFHLPGLMFSSVTIMMSISQNAKLNGQLRAYDYFHSI